MVAFAAASYVLWFNPALLAELENAIADAVPSGLSHAVNPILEAAIEQRNSLAGIGFVAALWSSVWWMSNLREAVSAQWELPAPNPAALQRLVFDLRALDRAGDRAAPHARVHRARHRAHRGRAPAAGRARRRRDPHAAAPGRRRARRRRELADLRVGDHPAAPHGRLAAGRATGGAARRGRLRGAQAGRRDLLRRDHEHAGRSGLRLAARPAALRLPRGAAAAVGDGVGGHRAGQRARRPGARPRGRRCSGRRWSSRAGRRRAGSVPCWCWAWSRGRGCAAASGRHGVRGEHQRAFAAAKPRSCCARPANRETGATGAAASTGRRSNFEETRSRLRRNRPPRP